MKMNLYYYFRYTLLLKITVSIIFGNNNNDVVTVFVSSFIISTNTHSYNNNNNNNRFYNINNNKNGLSSSAGFPSKVVSWVTSLPSQDTIFVVPNYDTNSNLQNNDNNNNNYLQNQQVVVVPAPISTTLNSYYNNNINNHTTLTTNHTYRYLDEITQQLLNSTAIGGWDASSFEHVETIIEAWSVRQSRHAAMEVERLLRRIIEEQKVGNPYADAVDMTALYTNLIIGWANSGERGGPERAEEILHYYQLIYEEHDCYDPLLCGPDITAFNAVIAAYARSYHRRTDAPEQAIRVLSTLYNWNRQGRTIVTPNTETYAHVLRAYARTTSVDAPARILKMLQHMEELSYDFPSVKPDYHCHNTYLMAIIENTNRGHICRSECATICQTYLEKMLQCTESIGRPDIWTFNMVLNAWSKSNTVDMVQRAESVLCLLETYHDTCGRSAITQPNANTYNTIMACYSRSNILDKVDRAYALLQKMKSLSSQNINPSAKPDAITYNIVMNMFAKTKRRHAPMRVEELLIEMTASYIETKDRKMRPSTRSVNTCLDAWAKSGLDGADDRIWEWITRMKGGGVGVNACSASSSSSNQQQQQLTNVNNFFETTLQLRPDKWTYNTYLQALAKGGKSNIGTTAEMVLAEMEERHRNGGHDIKPDVVTFTNVIHCIALSGQENAVDRALAILNRMEDLLEQGYGDLRPNLFTYNCVINTIAKSKRPGKAQLALDVLRRAEDAAIRPVIVSYNNVLNACAFSNPEQDDPATIMDIALQVLHEAQNGPGANWITYQTVLRAVCSFVPNDLDTRWDITKTLFEQCCTDGQLTQTVLSQIRFALNDDIRYATLADTAIDPQTKRLLDTYSTNAKLSMKAHKTRIVST